MKRKKNTVRINFNTKMGQIITQTYLVRNFDGNMDEVVMSTKFVMIEKYKWNE